MEYLIVKKKGTYKGYYKVLGMNIYYGEDGILLRLANRMLEDREKRSYSSGRIELVNCGRLTEFIM